MSKTSNFIFNGLHIVAWLIFAALGIEAGALILNFFFSLYNPEIIPLLYQKLDITEVYQENPLIFFGVYGLVVFISVLKAYLFYIVVRLMHKMDLSKPFNDFVAKHIALISHYTLFIGLLGYIGAQLVKYLSHYGLDPQSLDQFWTDREGFVLMGVVVYIIAAIFRKGVDIQEENDLTV